MHVVAMVDGAEAEVTIEFDPEHGTVGELVAAITGQPGGILTDHRSLSADIPLSEAGLRQGAVLRFGDSAAHPPAADGVVELRTVGGLSAGRTVRLPSGEHVIGRSGAAVELASTTVSARHAGLEIAADGTASISDLGSRNGTAVESYLLPGRCILEDGQVIQVGAVRLSVARPATGDVPVLGPPRRNGTVAFNRPPRSVGRLDSRPITAPAKFREPGAGVRFSWMAVAMPAVFGIGMGVLINPTMALFSLLSPVMAIGNYSSDKKRVKKQRAAGLEEQEQSVDEFRLTLIRRRTLETAFRRTSLPDPAEVVRRATAPSTHLWERRAAHDDFLRLCVGTANVPWEPAMATKAGSFGEAGELPAEAAELLADLGHLPFVPVALDLSAGHTVGLVGDRAAALALMRSLVCQAVVHHGPVDVRLAVLTDSSRTGDWEWAKWLPHSQGLDETLGRRMLATTAEDVDTVLAELLTKPDTSNTSFGKPEPTGPVTLVVVDVPGLTEGRNSPARELLAGAGQPVCGIVYASSVDRLPAVCTSIVELSGAEGLARFREPGANVEIPDVLVSGVPADLAAATARALAGLEDPEIATVGADLPDRASLVTILDLDPTADTLLGRWKAAGQVPRLAAPIGIAETGPLVIDLVADGPHGLIAGTTGAGKSELLRTMVASLAANTGPEHLNFLLIDYKGGSAFAQCEALPHTVGMVTDLDEHLGQRALRCLEAELHYRERRLRESGASDLKEYLLQGNTEALPRLVVIIDEFATMVAELPDFIDSLVGVAQRGRSLGVHMILATQRPGGAVNNNIRANTNLRISLRVQDVAESADVIGSPLAAAIGRYQAGRGYLRLGPGEIFPFQTALVTGVTQEAVAAGITVRPYAFGPDPNGDAGAGGSASAAPPPGPADTTPSDLERLVAAAAAAARSAGIPPSRRPCPDALPERVTLDDLGAVETTGFAAPFGLLDDPDRQAQGPITLDPLAGNILFFGVSGAGTTSALATLAISLARTQPVERLHLYVLDFGTQALSALAPLPHCGAVVGAADLERQARLMRQLNDELDRRRSWVAESGAPRVDPTDPNSPFPLIVLLLDNFAGFASQYEMGSIGGVRDQFSRLVSDGPGLGVVVAVNADRPNAVPGAVAALVPQKLVFRLGDVSDFGLVGIPPRDVPKLPAGRAIDASSKLEVQVALPGPDGLAAAVAAVTAGIDLSAVDPARRPRPIGTLVADVTLAEIADGLSIGDDEWVIPVGMGDASLAPVALRIPTGEHVLIAGPPRSGKSTCLDAIAAMVGKTNPEVAITAVAFRRSPLLTAKEVGRTVATPDALETALEEISAQPGPQLILIDDCDGVDDPMNALNRLLSASRPDLHVIAAGRADVLRGTYGNWTATLRRSRMGIGLKPDPDRDGELFGATFPRKATNQWPVGRGYAVAEGNIEVIQAAHR